MPRLAAASSNSSNGRCPKLSVTKPIRMELSSCGSGSPCLVNLCVELTHLHPAMLLTRTVNRVNDLVHSIRKADIWLHRLVQGNGGDEVMRLDGLLIVVP